MPVARTKRRFRGLSRNRIKLAKRVLTKLLNLSVVGDTQTPFSTADQVVAVNVVLAALIADLAATDPR